MLKSLAISKPVIVAIVFVFTLVAFLVPKETTSASQSTSTPSVSNAKEVEIVAKANLHGVNSNAVVNAVKIDGEEKGQSSFIAEGSIDCEGLVISFYGVINSDGSIYIKDKYNTIFSFKRMFLVRSIKECQLPTT